MLRVMVARPMALRRNQPMPCYKGKSGFSECELWEEGNGHGVGDGEVP